MRKPLIAANWKMNTGIEEGVTLVTDILDGLKGSLSIDIALCPPFVSLQAISRLLTGTTIELGAQNMHFKERGAYTGEISASMLKTLCKYVILGHSERRQYFFETDDVVHSKVEAALAVGLIPILCVGESGEQNERGKTGEVLLGQVTAALRGIRADASLVIAYEPIWAIGTGRAATADQACSSIKVIRSAVAGLWGETIAAAIRILYGGSVTGANIAEFIRHEQVDGALVGGASLKAVEFLEIVRQTALHKSAR